MLYILNGEHKSCSTLSSNGSYELSCLRSSRRSAQANSEIRLLSKLNGSFGSEVIVSDLKPFRDESSPRGVIVKPVQVSQYTTRPSGSSCLQAAS